MFHLFLLTSLLVQVTPLPTNVVNRCPQPTALEPLPPVFFYGHPDDCQYYFQCSFGTPYLMPCPAQTSFSEVLQVCVHRYSPEDTCAQQNAARECTRGASILADGNNCHRFYNCSQPTSTFVGLGSYQDECPYPQWFDSTDNTCKHYSQVTCSNRKQVKDKCDYVKNYQCFDAQHCVPCSSIFPSCIGRQDGIQPHPSKPWSPDYIECTDERVSTFTCPSVHGTTGFFSPDKNKCVSIYEVSQSFYFLGQLPSCLGKMPGTYPVTADPSVYFSCPGPVVGYCPDGYIFKELDQSCHLK